MRVVVFFVYFFLHLLGVGNNFHAAAQHNHIYNSVTCNLAKNEQVIFAHNTHGSIIIGDADLDLEEEYQSHDDLKDCNSNKFSTQKNSFQGKCYLVHSQLYFLNQYARRFKIFPPICGNSNPIYITQRVLRV